MSSLHLTIPGFNFIRGDDILLTSSGIIIREDWFEALGLKEPSTPDELYNVLVAFRNKKGATVPFSTDLGGVKTVGERGYLNTIFLLVVGVTINLIFTTMGAYFLAVKG